MMIVGWVGAGFRDCLFQAIIVGEPAPTANDFEGDFLTAIEIFDRARAVGI
ncbi:hypothetical protein [Microcoleus sp.]